MRSLQGYYHVLAIIWSLSGYKSKPTVHVPKVDCLTKDILSGQESKKKYSCQN